jgi:hypothetical protein
METTDTEAGLHKCSKQWKALALLFAPMFLFALLFILSPLIPDTPLFYHLIAPPGGVFVFYLIFVGIKSTAMTTLFVSADGLGVRYGKLPIKWIYWRDIDRLSTISRGSFSWFLIIRFKSYLPWLNQFSDNEAGYFLSYHNPFLLNLYNLPRLSQLSPEDQTLVNEVNNLNKGSPHYNLAKNMLLSRKEQRSDIAFSSFICPLRDLAKVDKSYVEWLENHKV